MQKGFCVTKSGRDQNSGVKKLMSGDINTDAKKNECLQKCAQVNGMKGCEAIWSQGNRGCYVHTKAIDRGNGRGRHACWVRGKEPEPEVEEISFGPMENGFCVTKRGRDQNSGVRKLASGDF
jgi:hypothetical protein